MTVADLEERMSNAEFLRWSIFHALRAQQAEVEQKMAAARGRGR